MTAWNGRWRFDRCAYCGALLSYGATVCIPHGDIAKLDTQAPRRLRSEAMPTVPQVDARRAPEGTVSC